MRLKVIGSSSKGNCYIMESNDEILILEAGCDTQQVGQAIGFQWQKVVAVLVTHEHMDHARHIRDFQARGLRVFASRGTREATGNKAIEELNTKIFWRFGGFSVRWFEVWHDAREPVGFLIRHSECGTLLFVTDTARISQRFEGLNHIMVEANYDEDNEAFKGLPQSHIERVRLSHMSLDKTLEFIKHTNTSKVDNVLLLHISGRHGRKDDFLAKARDLGINAKIEVATPGLDININLEKLEF